MLQKLPKVSVIFPTLNEAKNLPLIFPYIPYDLVSEVVVVDGRSTDDTVEVARELLPSVKIVLEATPGKGAALRAGYRAATGDILVVIDADGSNDPRELPRYVRALLEGADFVKGSRFAHNGGTTDMPRYRKFGNAVFVSMVNTLFDTAFTDLCYGYHAFWRYCLDLIDLENVDGFEIDTALYIRALRERLRISEVPSFEGYRFYGIGKLQTLPDGWRVLYTIMNEWVAQLGSKQKVDYLGFRGPVRRDLQSAFVLSDTAVAAADVWPFRLPDGQPLSASIPACSPTLKPADARSELVQALNQMLATEIHLSEPLGRTLQLILDSIGGSSASLVTLDPDGTLVDGCFLYGGKAHSIPASQLTEVVEQGLIGWVIKNRQPALVSSTRKDPRWLRRAWEQENEGFARSALGFPLFVNERLAGVLTVMRPEPEQFSTADLEVVTHSSLTPAVSQAA